MKVFLSHNSSDKEFVKRVAVALAKKGIYPWVDVWEMKVGDLLMPTLEKAIESCDCFILFWSSGSKAAPWVEWERKNAERLQGKPRICVRLENIVPPPELSQRIWLDWINWKDGSSFNPTLDILIRSILGKPYEDSPFSTKLKPTSGIRRAKLTGELFEAIFSLLGQHYGVQNWWIRDDKFQLCIEAILSQGTGWKNVGLAINNLRAHNVLTPNAIKGASEDHISVLVRPCGRAKTKASYIKNFVAFLGEYYDLDLNRMLREETATLRRRLLGIKGIGEFTCDNILLYAADRPKLPINDRMRKVLYEHDLIDEVDTYESAQSRLENVIPMNPQDIREFDAMIYRVARDFCHPIPKCEKCPLKQFLHKQGPRSQRV